MKHRGEEFKGLLLPSCELCLKVHLFHSPAPCGVLANKKEENTALDHVPQRMGPR